VPTGGRDTNTIFLFLLTVQQKGIRFFLLELAIQATFMHKLHHSALPKIYDNFFKNISNNHSYKT